MFVFKLDHFVYCVYYTMSRGFSFIVTMDTFGAVDQSKCAVVTILFFVPSLCPAVHRFILQVMDRNYKIRPGNEACGKVVLNEKTTSVHVCLQDTGVQ